MLAHFAHSFCCSFPLFGIVFSLWPKYTQTHTPTLLFHFSLLCQRFETATATTSQQQQNKWTGNKNDEDDDDSNMNEGKSKRSYANIWLFLLRTQCHGMAYCRHVIVYIWCIQSVWQWQLTKRQSILSNALVRHNSWTMNSRWRHRFTTCFTNFKRILIVQDAIRHSRGTAQLSFHTTHSFTAFHSIPFPSIHWFPLWCAPLPSPIANVSLCAR